LGDSRLTLLAKLDASTLRQLLDDLEEELCLKNGLNTKPSDHCWKTLRRVQRFKPSSSALAAVAVFFKYDLQLWTCFLIPISVTQKTTQQVRARGCSESQAALPAQKTQFCWGLLHPAT